MEKQVIREIRFVETELLVPVAKPSQRQGAWNLPGSKEVICFWFSERCLQCIAGAGQVCSCASPVRGSVFWAEAGPDWEACGYDLDIPKVSVTIMFRSGFIAVFWILNSLGAREENSSITVPGSWQVLWSVTVEVICLDMTAGCQSCLGKVRCASDGVTDEHGLGQF